MRSKSNPLLIALEQLRAFDAGDLQMCSQTACSSVRVDRGAALARNDLGIRKRRSRERGLPDFKGAYDARIHRPRARVTGFVLIESKHASLDIDVRPFQV